jgi:DNA-binding Lrp family transcriptional regulator
MEAPMLTALPHLTQVIRALAILKPDEPIDAKTLADLIDLVPKEVSRCLSKLHRTGYLAKIGANEHYNLYILTQRRLPTHSASVERTYRRRLTKASRTNYIAPGKQLAKEISAAVIQGIRREFRLQAPSPAWRKAGKQLTLFEIS